MPADIPAPGGWCSQIKIQVNTPAGGPGCISSAFLKDGPPSERGQSENLKRWPPEYQGFLSKAWNHALGELPPPKTLGIKSAGINLGGLCPSGSPLLHCYASHWPGAPCLLVPSDRHDEHYSNKPRSMRHFCNFQVVPAPRAHPKVPRIPPPSPPASNTSPPHPRVSAGRAFPPQLPTIPTPTATSGTFPRLTSLPEARV